MVAIYPNEALLFSGRILMSANYTLGFLKRQADECCMIHADQIIEYYELIDTDSSKTWHHSVPIALPQTSKVLLQAHLLGEVFFFRNYTQHQSTSYG